MKNHKALLFNIFIVALLSIAILSSCKKDVPATTRAGKPTILLSKIINNSVGSVEFGKIIDTFTYSGKLLTKVVRYNYSHLDSSPSSPIDSVITTAAFSYTNTGVLTGIQIEENTGNGFNIITTQTVITDSAGNIIILITTQSNSSDFVDSISDTIDYQNNLVSNWRYSGLTRLGFVSSKTSFTYDSNANNISKTTDELPQPDMLVNSTFDSYHNIAQAVPYWIYFNISGYEPLLFLSPGLNNPVDASKNGTALTFNYEYNTYGYPSKISWNDTTPLSYKFEYISVY